MCCKCLRCIANDGESNQRAVFKVGTYLGILVSNMEEHSNFDANVESLDSYAIGIKTVIHGLNHKSL